MTKSILLIDDNLWAFKPLVAHLSSLGFRVQTAGKEENPVEKVMRVRPHAVLVRKRSRATRERIQSDLRTSSIPVVIVKSARRKIVENVQQLELALLEASFNRR